MKYLKIKNKGVLDIRLVALMGGTTKENDLYKIGQFGTGLKYTMAYLFRNNIDFKIFAGENEVKLHLETEVIKDEEFKIICIDGNRTSITTKMGRDWEAWMIVRELYSNALDEGSAEYSISDKALGESETTSFFIELTPDFLRVYNDWNNYFIVGRVPMYETESFALHPSNGTLKIYKQGILIFEDEKAKGLFNYDIKNASINELRQYTGYLPMDISRIWFGIEDKSVVKYILENIVEKEPTLGYKYYETTVDLVFWYTASKFKNVWSEVLGNAKVIHTKAMEEIIARNANVDLSGAIEVPHNIYKALTQSFDGIGALRVADKVNEFYEVYDHELELKLKSALATLESSDYFIHPELTFIFGEFGCKTTLAKIDLDKKEVLISHRMKDKSMFDFCAMLVEESEHFQTGYSDHTREFQTHFIHLYVKSMFDKAKIKI